MKYHRSARTNVARGRRIFDVGPDQLDSGRDVAMPTTPAAIDAANPLAVAG